ncbi:MAG: ATP-binding protein [Alphaproteobacteria bacterium]
MISKRFLPKSLFGRALLILILPTVLIQLVMVFVFFDRHWQSVTRYMNQSLAGEMAFLLDQLETVPLEQTGNMIRSFERATAITVFFDPPEAFNPSLATGDFPQFQQTLRHNISKPFTVRRIARDELIEVSIQQEHNTLRLLSTVKRLESRTTVIYLVWVMATSVIFLVIAVIFLRNQIRPIGRLAKAAEDFGRGLDSPGFRPHGAREVRQAAKAFVVMRERISRQVRARTEMLAGISHDLRTPLTRMKLQLAMLEDSEAAKDLSEDVQQMEHMIEEYLDFVRGGSGEETAAIDLHGWLAGIVEDYQRHNAPVTLGNADEVKKEIRPIAFTRALHNLIDNALRYGKRCNVHLHKTVNYCEIVIDDEGMGIPVDKQDEVFKPFTRLDASRNMKTGGVGLGLTIARDVVLAHGGNISLETSPAGGLRVVIRLPL